MQSSVTLPPLFNGRRKPIFLRLLTVSLLEAATFFWLTVIIKSITLKVSSDITIKFTDDVIILLFLCAILSLCFWRGAILSEKLGMDYVGEIRIGLYQSVVNNSMKQQHSRLGSTMARMLSDLSAVRDWVSLGLPTSIIASATLIAAIASLLTIDLFMGLIITILLLLSNVIIVGFLIRSLDSKTLFLRRYRGRLSSYLADIVSGAFAITHFYRVKGERNRLKQHNQLLKQASVQRKQISTGISILPIISVPLAIAIIAIFVALGYQFDVSHAADWSGLLFSLGLLAASLFVITKSVDQFVAFRVARKRLLEIYQNASISQKNDNKVIHLESSKSIHVNISPFKLANINIATSAIALAEENILLLGPSGCGKSSLLKHIISPDSTTGSRIYLNHIPVSRISRRSLSRCVQSISQDVPLLRGSVMRNLTYGKRSPSNSWLQEVIEICQLKEIVSLSEHCSFRVEQGSRNIASGVATRLRLARALLTKPGLLIVDDPVFLYDPEAQAALARAKQSLSLTLIVAAPSYISIPNLTFHRTWQLPRISPTFHKIDEEDD